MFRLVKTEAKARRGELVTVHGTVQTPAFQNVATCGAIKGGLSALDLRETGCQIMLSNTYHLHVRTGDALIRELGGLRSFCGWDGPLLTDSGGFQVFSLAGLRKISEAGVNFSCHIDGRKIFMGPEESMRIQSNLGSTIAMAFDECVGNPADYEYLKLSCERTLRWARRCKEELERLNSRCDTLNNKQLLFGINQGGTSKELRTRNMAEIAKLDLDGYAIGGLAVGESKEEMYECIDYTEPLMPENKIRYLMGVGTPGNIIEAVARGIDLFDCVLPSRNARHGQLYTSEGIRNLNNLKYEKDEAPIDEACSCPVCKNFSRAYIRHLFKAGEILAMRLCVMHNLFFYNELLRKCREAIEEGRFQEFRESRAELLDRRI